jgi:hypothetical protein
LTLEAHGHHEPREIGNDEEIEVNKNSNFSANDGDEDS